ncbi:MAG: helix-turn-helix transcriptional regulator [Opitutae bacterium]|nr:helix-turn-helix transcriptional regulator [Opitutae bacterium]
MPPPRKSGDDATLRKLGQSIQAERKSRDLTQEAVSETIGISARAYQAIEAGRVNVPATTLIRIKNALGASWESLLPR